MLPKMHKITQNSLLKKHGIFCLTFYNAFIRLVDVDTGTEICRFNLSENYNGMTGLVVGEIYKRNGDWKFNAIGQPVQEASRLDSLIRLYV